MRAIFVSYARVDEAFADTLHGALVDAGYAPWLDIKELSPSPDWRARLEHAIERADALAFVVSPEAIASEVCMHELRHAVAHGKPVVGVRWRDPRPAGLPHELAAAPCVDVRAGVDVGAAFRRSLVG